MKTPKIILTTALIASLFLIINCEKKEVANPFDLDCPKEIFTPADFKAELQGTSIKLSWTQANTSINGFVINRKENDGAYNEVARVDKSILTWTDTKLLGGVKYGYQLFAYAGANLSNAQLAVLTTPAYGATLTTAAVASITSVTAVLGGNITSDGGSTVTDRGVCYAVTQNPTIANSKMAMGNGIGTFSNTVSGLTMNTTYYARAYATNSNGTSYGNEVSFKTSLISVATVSTLAATSITTGGALLGGEVSADGGATVTERGVCYAITQNPTTSNTKLTIGNGTGQFSNTITGLTANTTYYARAYAINSQGTAYGSEVSFKTLSLSVPTVTTATASGVTATSALLGGNVTVDGGANVTERGVCYATTQNPTTSNLKLAIGSGLGAFSNTITGLTTGTLYYARAYATNSQGTAYGPEISFTTIQLSLATVSTSAASTVTAVSAVLGGNITSDGGATVTERGVCYSTSQNPTTANSKLAIGNGTGTFSNTVSGLTEGTVYYARAYAINSQGTAYGTQITFTTTQHALATVSTAEATSITGNTAILGGNVTNDGNVTVTERGVCYGVVENPTTGNTKLAIGNGTGAFSNVASGLSGNTTYYARAYAINSKGTAYGNQITFKTAKQIILASLSTSGASTITSNSAVLGGNITDDGGGVITERGICYQNTGTNPTITSSPKVIVGNGSGLFSTTVTGLIMNSTYYVRAYAINSAGTSYGSQITFITSGNLATITTKEVTNILETGAIAGGIVTSDEGSAVTERGICYGTSQNPTIYDTKIASGSGVGGFNTPLNILVPNSTYYTRAYATNKNGTAYGENKSFKTVNAYYAGFENGIPAGWTGMWSVSSDSPFEGFYCLKSVNAGEVIEFSRIITNPSGGQISFFHKGVGQYYSPSADFYIDNILQSKLDGYEGWTIHSYPVTSGQHTFKWKNNGGGSINTHYIDYVICTQ